MRIIAALLLLIGCGSTPKTTPLAITPSIPAPTFLTAQIVNKHPHSPDAYTQGLLWHNGKLYESVGQYGQSAIRIVDLETGVAKTTKKNASSDFGEGIAVAGDKIYQLTWQEGKAYIYSASTLAKIGQFQYFGEGWGLTSFADTLYMSDGTSTIKVIDPANFRTTRVIDVVDNRGPVDMINELEYINGRLYANLYTSPLIAVIDPATGIVESYIDCSLLINSVGNPSQIDFLNGIAYDPDTNRILATGKLYDTLFEITF